MQQMHDLLMAFAFKRVLVVQIQTTCYMYQYKEWDKYTIYLVEGEFEIVHLNKVKLGTAQRHNIEENQVIGQVIYTTFLVKLNSSYLKYDMVT